MINIRSRIGPHWSGELPEGIKAITVESEQGWLLGRMLVDGPEDFPAAKALVDDIWMIIDLGPC